MLTITGTQLQWDPGALDVYIFQHTSRNTLSFKELLTFLLGRSSSGSTEMNEDHLMKRCLLCTLFKYQNSIFKRNVLKEYTVEASAFEIQESPLHTTLTEAVEVSYKHINTFKYYGLFRRLHLYSKVCAFLSCKKRILHAFVAPPSDSFRSFYLSCNQ